MGWFIAEPLDGEKTFSSDNGTWQRYAPCNTAACVAGWSNLLTGGEDATDDTRAAIKLGILTVDQLEGMGRFGPHPLFDRQGWPEPFNSQYAKAKTAKVRVKIASARLDYLMETGE